MPASPKVSIIMGVYNCEKTLPEAIDSILNQTFQDWEFVICDDCSTDGTYKILEEYKKQYPDKFVLLSNEKTAVWRPVSIIVCNMLRESISPGWMAMICPFPAAWKNWPLF